VIYLIVKNKNKSCSCGSGKKYKRCCGLKVPRKTVIALDFGRPVPVTSIRNNPITNEIEVFSSLGQKIVPKSVSVEYNYEKTKSDKVKVLTKYFEAKKAYLSLPVRTLKDYDIIYAVDTNWRSINGVRLCSTGVVRASPLNIVVPGKTGVNYALKFCFSFASTADKPENQAWNILINRIPLWESISGKTIGLIVDSDLGNLEKYNKREDSFFENHMLPHNMSLIYASAERDLGNPMNKMINLADVGAGLLLGKFIESQKKHWEILCFDDIKVWRIEQRDPKSITFHSP
jgi:SEC-C motif